MGVAEVRRLKQLEGECAKLKQPLAGLSLDKAILKDVLRKESDSLPAPRARRVRAGCLPGDGASGMPRAVRLAGNDSIRVGEARAGESSDADETSTLVRSPRCARAGARRGSTSCCAERAGWSITSAPSARIAWKA